MAKLNKDQVQKIILILIMLVMVVVAYLNILLKPLSAKEKRLTAEIASLQGSVDTANRQIRNTQSLREQAATAEETIAHFVSTIPEGSPIAWFPLRIRDFFERFDVQNSATRQLDAVASGIPEFAGWSEMGWAIDLSRIGFIQAGIAIAALENEELLMEIDSLSITTSEQDPEFQQFNLGTTFLLPQ